MTTMGDTDLAVKAAVLDELGWSPGVDGENIGVLVNRGVVTLSGEVDSFPEKRQAEQAAWRVRGVTAVAEQLTVRHPGEDHCLLQAIALLRHHQTHGAGSRPEQARSVLGSQVRLPSGVPIWRHVKAGGRELATFGDDGGSFIVHDLEPAGASFLVHRDGEPRARRGPALTLRRVGESHDVRFIVFSDDLGDRTGS